MAISTIGVFLTYCATQNGTYSKLCDIKSYPDMIGDPELLETTTMSDNAQTYIPGLQSQDVLQFTANYSTTDWATVNALAGQSLFYKLCFGDQTGSAGAFTWKGQHKLGLPGGDVNSVVEMNINIIPETAVTKVAVQSGGSGGGSGN